MEYDAVVVGAGPAGSASARDIGRAGFKVLLLEEHKIVGEPAHCSGLISPRALELAGVSDGLVINEIKGAIVHSAVGEKGLTIGGERTHALVIDRASLDRRLAEQAQEYGGELVLGAKLAGIEREDHHLSLDIRKGERELRVSTKLLVGADGVHSRVRKWLGEPLNNTLIQAIGAEARLSVDRPDFVDVFVGREVAPGWFGWCIPLGQGRVRIGTGGISGTRSPRELLANLVDAFPRRFRDLKLNAFYGGSIPIYTKVKTYDDNVLLVGDAAFQVKPTSGGGICAGLMGAKHCAATAIGALNKDDFSEKFLSKYETSWRAEFGDELERGSDLRRVYTSLSDEEIHKLLNLFQRAALAKIIARYGDIDFPSSMFKRLLKVAPILTAFIRIPLNFPTLWFP